MNYEDLKDDELLDVTIDGEDKKKHTCVIEEWCDQQQIWNKEIGVFCK